MVFWTQERMDGGVEGRELARAVLVPPSQEEKL